MSYERLEAEGLVPLGQLRRAMPGRPAPPTVHRWIVSGVRARSGAAVKLEAVRVGRRWFSTRQALARFVEAASGTAQAPAAPAPPPNARAVERKLQAIFGNAA